MKITPGESPGANERTIRTAGTNRLQHRIRFMEGLNHDTKIVNIPNNRPLCRIKSRMQDRNNSVTQLIRYMKNSFRQPAPGCNRKRTKRCGISSCRSPDRRAAPPVLMESTPANGTATPGDRRPPDNTLALQQIARDIAPGLKSVYMSADPALPKPHFVGLASLPSVVCPYAQAACDTWPQAKHGFQTIFTPKDKPVISSKI